MKKAKKRPKRPFIFILGEHYDEDCTIRAASFMHYLEYIHEDGLYRENYFDVVALDVPNLNLLEMQTFTWSKHLSAPDLEDS